MKQSETAPDEEAKSAPLLTSAPALPAEGVAEFAAASFSLPAAFRCLEGSGSLSDLSLHSAPKHKNKIKSANREDAGQESDIQTMRHIHLREKQKSI